MEDIILDSAFTVSQVNSYIKERFAVDENLRYITVKGEVSNFTNHVKTGHFYFTLKDEASSIKAIMFKGNSSKIKFNVENGMNVIIQGSIRVFERDGTYQLYCETLDPDGVGALYLAFEQLKEKLAKEGVFDEALKKPIPQMPRRIGVITSKTGAAFQDILNILTRRYPIGTVVLFSALVQGENAPASIVEGIEQANNLQQDIDVLIVGRGGGSIEDLWCFNNENVARAIYNSRIPVISAVGHEIDFTISDFAADLRAPTPSAAAELCAPDVSGIYEKLDNYAYLLRGYTINIFKEMHNKLKANYEKLVTYSPSTLIANTENELNAKNTRMKTSIEHILELNNQRFAKAVATLDALSPLKVVTRGYSITKYNDKIITDANKLKVGETISIQLKKGEIKATVDEIIKN